MKAQKIDFSFIVINRLLNQLIAILGVIVCCCISVVTGQLPSQVPPLLPGQVISDEIADNKSPVFTIHLNTQQYLNITIEKFGIDISIKCFDPEGNLVGEMESPYDHQGRVSLSVIATKTGNHRVTLQPLKQAQPGRYQLQIGELRTATDRDQLQIKAEQAFINGRKLRLQPGVENKKSAIDSYQKALSYWQSLDDIKQQIATCYCIGVVRKSLKEISSALTIHEQAVQLAQSIDYQRGQAYSLNDIGLCYASNGNMNRALDYYQRALPYWETEQDKINKAATLNNIAGAHDVLGNATQALEYYQHALQLREQAKNWRGIVTTLNNIGALYGRLAEYQQALRYYTQALSYFDRLDNPQLNAILLENIGYTYGVLGDWQTALEKYQESLTIFIKLKATIDQAHVSMNIGNAYRATGDITQAFSHYHKSLKIFQENKVNWGQIYVLCYLGEAEYLNGQPRLALSHFQAALKLQKDIDDPRASATILNQLGQVFTSLNNLEQANEYLERALKIWQSVRDRQNEANTLYAIARVALARNNPGEANQRIDAALNIIEAVRTRLSNQQLRISYFATVQDYYQLAIDVKMQLHRLQPTAGHDIAALQISERARARNLLDLLSEARVDIRQGVDLSLLSQERELDQQLAIKAERMTSLLNSKKDQSEIEQLDKELNQLLLHYHRIRDQIRSDSPRYALITQPRSLSLGEIQQELLDPDTLLLEYSLGSERSYLWVVSNNGITSYQLPPAEQIEALARQLYQLLSDQKRDANNRDRQYRAIATKLSHMILSPVLPQLHKQRLLIVAQGTLQLIPFAALPVEREFLMDRHEIINLPSGATLASIRRERSICTAPTGSVAILADPVFETDDPRIKRAGNIVKAAEQAELVPAIKRNGNDNVGKNSVELTRLPATRMEAEAIKTAVGNGALLMALDFKANRATAFSAELRNYQIIHFATHGLTNTKYPELASIVLSLVDEQGQPQNGFLRLSDIYNLNLCAKMVVLSACNTGVGKDIRGEGLVGLTRGFIYAGSSRIVASLWQVDDEATAVLMQRFYREILQTGQSPAAALKTVQREMSREKRWRSPYYWAGFILMGEYQ